MIDRARMSTLMAVLVSLLTFFFVWSTALYLLLGFSIDTVRPWSAIEFTRAYGLKGAQGSALGTSFLIALCLGLVAGVALFLSRPKHYYGDARWASKKEVRAAHLLDQRGVLLGRLGSEYLRNHAPGHVLVTAPTRAGKGVGVVVPNLLSWPDSVVVLDIKHENHQLTSGFRAKHGQDVFQWSPADDDGRSHAFNPLDTVRGDIRHRVSDIQRLGAILLPSPAHGDDSMWQDEARDLFLGVVLYVLDTPDVPSTLGEVYRTLKTDSDLADVIEHIIANRGDELDPNAAMSLANFVHKSLKERSGVKSNLTAALNLWANPVIDAATASSDFSLSDLRRKRMSIYVGVSLNQLSFLSRLLNLFFQQTVDVLSRQAPDRDESVQVMLLIDEFASLGRMDTVTKAMAFLAGFNVRMVNIVQGLGQVDQLYGHGRQDILQNSSLQLYFAANDETTANYVSKRLGTKTIRTHSRTDPGGFGWASKSSSWAPRDLMLPEEVRQLKDSSEILFKESQRPVLAKKIRYYTDPVFKRRILPPAAVPLLKVEAIAPRRFELPDDSADLEEADSDLAFTHPQDEVDISELTAMAAELEHLLTEEAEQNDDDRAASAAASLKAAADNFVQ